MSKPSTLTLRLTAEEAEQLEALKQATGRKTGSEVIKHLMKEFPTLKQAYESEKDKCKTLNNQLKQRKEAAETFVGALDQFIKLTKKQQSNE